MKFSLVIPCYNESGNLKALADKLHRVFSDKPDYEVILVNNGSTDSSAILLEEIRKQHAFIKVVHVEKNQGYGHGILQGLYAASGEILGWTHADLQTDPHDVIKGLDFFSGSSNTSILVKGNRKGRSFFDTLFTTGMSCFESLLFKTFLWDINAQPTLFSKTFFQSLKHPPFDFSLDLYIYMMAKVKKHTILRFPVHFPPRVAGQSSWNTGLKSRFKFIKRTVSYSMTLKRKLSDSHLED